MRMTIKVLAERGQSNRAIARLLGVHENAVRHHRRRLAAGATDGRARRTHLAALTKGSAVISTCFCLCADDGAYCSAYHVPRPAP
jgi:hypothetical protein